MNKQTKVKKHKKASIVFPIVGAAVVAGGVTAGVVLANNNTPEVAVDDTTLVLDPNSRLTTLSITIADEVKDNKVFAYITNDESSPVANGEDASAVVFNDTKTDNENLKVVRNKVSTKLSIDNIPTIAGKYTYKFDVTLVYNNNNNDEIHRELKGLSLTYEVEKDYVDITDPSKKYYEYEFTDKTGNGEITMEPFKYHGEIDEANFAVEYVSDEAEEAEIYVTPSCVIDPEKKEFTVKLDIKNGTDITNMEGMLNFKYNGEVVHSTRVVLTLIEKNTITIAGATFAQTQMLPVGSKATLAFKGFKYTGLDIGPAYKDNALKVIWHQDTTKDPRTYDVDIKLDHVDVTKPYGRDKSFDVYFSVEIKTMELLKETIEIPGSLEFEYWENGEKAAEQPTVEGLNEFSIRLIEGNTISVPDKGLIPEYAKFHINPEDTNDITPVNFVIPGFTYSGFTAAQLINHTLEGTFTAEDGAKFEAFAQITYVDPKTKTFEVTVNQLHLAQGQTVIIDSYIGRGTGKISGSFKFNEGSSPWTPEDYYYFDTTGDYKAEEYFQFNLYWEDTIRENTLEGSETRWTGTSTADASSTMIFEDIHYRGFETQAQQEKYTVSVTGEASKNEDMSGAVAIPAKQLSASIDWRMGESEIVLDDQPWYLMNASVKLTSSEATGGLKFDPKEVWYVQYTISIKLNPDDEKFEMASETSTIRAINSFDDRDVNHNIELDLNDATFNESTGKYDITTKLEGFDYSGFEAGTQDRAKAEASGQFNLPTGISANVNKTITFDPTRGETQYPGEADISVTFSFTEEELYKATTFGGTISVTSVTDTTSFSWTSKPFEFKTLPARSVTDKDVVKECTDVVVKTDGSIIATYKGFGTTRMTDAEIASNVKVTSTEWDYISGTATLSPEPEVEIINIKDGKFDLKVSFPAIASAITDQKTFRLNSEADPIQQIQFTYGEGAEAPVIGSTTELKGTSTGIGTIDDETATKTFTQPVSPSGTTRVTYTGFEYTGYVGYNVRDIIPTLTTTPTNASYEGEVTNVDTDNKTFDIAFDIPASSYAGLKEDSLDLTFELNDVALPFTQSDTYSFDLTGTIAFIEPDITQAEVVYSEGQAMVTFADFAYTGGDLTSWNGSATATGGFANIVDHIQVNKTVLGEFILYVYLKAGTAVGSYTGGSFDIQFAKDGATISWSTTTSFGIAVTKPAPTGISLSTTAGVTRLDCTEGNKSSVTVTANVTGTGDFSKKLIWKSTNEKVATVTKDETQEADTTNTINAVSAGFTTIIACSASDYEVLGMIDIWCAKSPTSITVNAPTQSLYVGGPVAKASAVIAGTGASQDVTWTSSDPTVATVDENGYITPINVGTFTVTATSKVAKMVAGASATPTYVSGTSGEITVSVAPIVGITECSLDDSEVSVGDTATLTTVKLIDALGKETDISADQSRVTVTTTDTEMAACTYDETLKQWKINATTAGVAHLKVTVNGTEVSTTLLLVIS